MTLQSTATFSGRLGRLLPVAAILIVLSSACSGGTSSTTVVPSTTNPPSTTQPLTTVPTTTSQSTTTTLLPTTTLPPTTTTVTPGIATRPFSVPVGDDGVTYDAGEPPSGPSSYVVLQDGSVVIADTMAVRTGEPRLLIFDAVGTRTGTISLRDAEVVSIIDVASDGERLAVLDIYVAMDRYRVLMLSSSGTVESVYEIPAGYRLENGLTGLTWDDDGVLLELEAGARYGRVTDDGAPEPTQALVFDNVQIVVTNGAGQTSTVEIGSMSFDIVRDTVLGGVTLIGIAPDGTVLLVLDEVRDTPQGIQVDRKVRRYTPTGELLGEQIVDAGEQYVQMSRSLEMTAVGTVAYFVTLEDQVEVRILDV